MAADAAGNLYVADYGSIRKITPAGTVSTFVGLVDGKSLFTFIHAMAADAAGNLYVADSCAIKKVSPSGEVSLLAGQVGVQGCVDGTGAAARFNYFSSMVVDSAGNLFVIDGNNYIVRKVTAAGVVSTWVGQAGTSGNADGTGTAAQFGYPSSLVIDATDNLYLADSGNGVVRKVTPAGVVSTISSSVRPYSILGLLPSGDLLVEAGNDLLTLSPADGETSPFALTGDRILWRSGFASTTEGIYISDGQNQTIDLISPTKAVTIKYGSALFGQGDGTGTAARFAGLGGMVRDAAGNLYVADVGNAAIRQITPAGVVTTWASGLEGLRAYSCPLAMDTAGNLYYHKEGGSVLCRIDGQTKATTTITVPGWYGGESAGLAIDAAGNIYLADVWGVEPSEDGGYFSPIRKIAPDGTATLINPKVVWGLGDGTQSGAFPTGMTIDQGGNLFVALWQKGIGKLTSTGTATMVLTDTQNIYQSVAVDATGTVFFDQIYGAGVGKVGATGAKEWIGGASALGGYADGLGRNAAFGAWGGRVNHKSPDLVVGDDGAVYMVDAGNNVIRKGTPISVTSALPEFTQSPVHTSTLASEAVTFTAKASVPDATLAPLQYAWQYLAPNGTTWVDVPYYDLQRAGATPGTVSLTLPPQSWLMRNGTQYRCVVTDAAYRTVTSTAATLAVTAQPGILWTSQSPYNVTPAALAADVSQVAIGANHTMILKKDGTLWGMGSNHQGQLGDGTTTDRPDPVRVDTEVAQVTTASDHTLYVKKDGSLWAVGDNVDGALGIGSEAGSIATPVKIAEGVREVYTSYSHSIFLKADRTLWTMGTGVLGDGTPASTKRSPVQIASGVDSCAIDMWSTAYTSGGTLYAVGQSVWASMTKNYPANTFLSMGRGELLPVPIRTGVQRLLPMRGRQGYAGGFVYIGDGPSGEGTYYVPVQWWFSKDYGVSTWDNVAGHPVEQLSSKTDFSLVGLAGPRESLFLLDGIGDLYAQKLTDGPTYGQLTDGTTQPHLTLDLVHRGVVDFSTSGYTTQFVTNDGMLWTTGVSLNASGTMNRQMSDVVSSACGGNSRFYLKADGTLWAMGNNRYGQLRMTIENQEHLVQDGHGLTR